MKGQVSAYSSRPHLDIEQEESTRSCTFTLFYNDLSKNASNLLPIEAKRRDEFKRGRRWSEELDTLLGMEGTLEYSVYCRMATRFTFTNYLTI
ncbi:hypothetical protein F9C07_13076 [Aspergillus flavus]|uniref:Uncharacterized protein n=1 Tax=Aspergillus flavus (strain ATCC 200026 / FGSC A1120 / IAM 13836 / NRRL 3357 / JCM 12722 / SRRC 167) TaxID=332952 RepID=A0A7U2N165_ASPFN|nr:hypothetical protein F9C07_13076 [Aspergillus flavus]